MGLAVIQVFSPSLDSSGFRSQVPKFRNPEPTMAYLVALVVAACEHR
jgi:hypothetical protein